MWAGGGLGGGLRVQGFKVADFLVCGRLEIRMFQGFADGGDEYLGLGSWKCVGEKVEETRLSLVDRGFPGHWPWL